MNSQIKGLRVAGAVFGLMALGQLLRLIIQPAVLLAGHVVPLWPSVIAVLIFLSLSMWLLRLARFS